MRPREEEPLKAMKLSPRPGRLHPFSDLLEDWSGLPVVAAAYSAVPIHLRAVRQSDPESQLRDCLMPLSSQEKGHWMGLLLRLVLSCLPLHAHAGAPSVM